MDPVTALKVVETIQKVAEASKKIQKIYNVSKEMKSVAESEGKDQIQVASRVASSANKFLSKETTGIKKSCDMQKSSDLPSKLESQYGDDFAKSDMPELKEGFPIETSKDKISVFVEDMPSTGEELPKPEMFDKSLPLGNKNISIFDEGIPSNGETLLKPEVFDDSIPMEKVDSPFEKLGIHENVFQNEGIPQQESISNTEQTVERNSEVTPIETAKNHERLETQHSAEISGEPEQKKDGLTDEQKKEIKENMRWSDTIVDSIRTMDEAQIYMDAGLQEGEVNGKPTLLQPKIDGKACNEPKWPDWSNKDLAEEGYPPRDETGTPYELHHIGQNPDSPLAELTFEQHHCNGNFKKLHTFDDSSIDRQLFNKERKEYWDARSQTL